MFLVFTVFKSNLLAVFYMVCAEKIFYGLNTHGIIFFIANAIFCRTVHTSADASAGQSFSDFYTFHRIVLAENFYLIFVPGRCIFITNI